MPNSFAQGGSRRSPAVFSARRGAFGRRRKLRGEPQQLLLGFPSSLNGKSLTSDQDMVTWRAACALWS